MTKAYPIQTRSTEGDGCVLTKPRGLALATRIVCGPTCGLPHQDQNFKRLYPRHTFLLNERLFIIFLFLFCSVSGSAQKMDRDLLRAEKLYKMEQFQSAIPFYAKALQREYEAVYCARLAECYRHQGEYLNAEHWYRLAAMAEGLEPKYFKQYAEVLRANGKMDEALEWYERYDRYAGNQQAHVPGYELAAEEQLVEPVFRAVLLDINSRFSEIAPTDFRGKLVFSSDKPRAEASKDSENYNGLYYDLFLSDPSQTGAFERSSRIRGAINSAWNDVGFCADPLTQQIWFTHTSSRGGKRVKDAQGIIHHSLYTAQWKGDRLTRIKRFTGISRNATAAHPSLTPDGSRLYFSASLENGFGGMDIWYCNRIPLKNGYIWSLPVNAGSRINTSGNELFPFAATSDRLYFSSDGHPGLGGLDLFQADFSAGSWEPVKHLSSPLSSERDDFGLFVINNQGYFSSNRVGGKGGDDIYAFERVRVRVEVHAVNSETGQPISGALVELITDGQNNLESRTDARGMATFDILPGVTFYFSIQKTGFDEILFTDTRNQDQFTVALVSEIQESDYSGLIEPSSVSSSKMYRIRIGVYRKPNLERLNPLREIGELFTEDKPNNTKAFYLGPFYQVEDASQALQRVKAMQFTDAFIEDWPE